MNEVFEDRKKGFEKKYELDKDLEFRVLSRRDKLFGAWLAEIQGLEGEEAEEYIRHIAQSNFKKPGDQDMLDQALSDFSSKGLSVEVSEMKEKLNLFFSEAKKQIEEE